ncbi:MAG: hypothetical protein PSX81_04870 [bacterium]|nr:hypothetical protein [bacterium]
MKLLISLILLFGGVELCAQKISLIGKWKSTNYGETTTMVFQSDSSVIFISGQSDTFNREIFNEKIKIIFTYSFNDSASPSQINLVGRTLPTLKTSMRIEGIYKFISKDKLLIRFGFNGEVRPKDFHSIGGQTMITLIRIE